MTSLCLLTACDPLPRSAYNNRGNPESQLTKSTDIVTLDIASNASLNTLSDKLAAAQPTHAVLSCDPAQKICKKARGILATFDVPTQIIGEDNAVALMYDRTETTDCDSSFVDNSQNSDNLNHPAFGCSLRSNTVNMVSDKKQFTNPSITGQMDGEKAAQNYDHYTNPSPAATASSGLSSSLVSSGISSSQ